MTTTWHIANGVDLQGSLRLIAEQHDALWVEVNTDLGIIGGAHRVLIGNADIASVRERLKSVPHPEALQVHLHGKLRSSPRLTFVESRGVEFYDHLLPGKANVLLKGRFLIEESGPRVYVDEQGQRVSRTVLWGWIETDYAWLGGQHRVLIASNHQVDRVADAARRWTRTVQSGPLRAEVRGILHSGREGVFTEARYVEFFGVPE